MFYVLRVKALAKARFLRGIETQNDQLVIKTSPFVVTDRLALYKAFGTNAVVRNQQVRIPRQPLPERWKADLLTALLTLRVVEAQGPESAAPGRSGAGGGRSGVGPKSLVRCPT